VLKPTTNQNIKKPQAAAATANKAKNIKAFDKGRQVSFFKHTISSPPL